MLGGLDYHSLAAAVKRALAVLPWQAIGDQIIGTGAGSYARKGVPANGQVRIADSSQADGTGWSDTPATFNWRNRLINPDGAIWVRAAAATADDVYFANNWYILSQTGTVTPSALTDPEDGYAKAVRITQSQAVAQRFGFAQIIEGKNCKDLRGQSGVLVPRVRFSTAAPLRYAILGWTGTEDAVTSDVVLDWTSGTYTAGNFFLAANVAVLAVGTMTPNAAAWTSLTALTAALGSTFNNLVVMVWTEGTAAQNVTLDFDYVQFERGSVPTAFERRPFSVEDMLCRRYLPYLASQGTNNAFGCGQALNATSAWCVFPFTVEARIAPTGITVSSTGHFSLTIADGTGAAASSFIFTDAQKTNARLQADRTGSGMVAGHCTTFVTNNASASIIFTGAEL